MFVSAQSNGWSESTSARKPLSRRKHRDARAGNRTKGNKNSRQRCRIRINRGIIYETNMASGSHYAGSLRLGRCANSGLDRFWNWWQQLQYRRGRNSKHNRHVGISKYSGRRYRRDVRNDYRNHSGQHCGTIDHCQSGHDFNQQSERDGHDAKYDNGQLGSSFAA